MLASHPDSSRIGNFVVGDALRPCRSLADELTPLGQYVVYESHRDGNWDLYRCKADGSDCVNLTGTKDCDELYPHVSPDGWKICFLADEVREPRKSAMSTT